MLTIAEDVIAISMKNGSTLDKIIDDVNAEMKDKIRKFAEYTGSSGLSQYVAGRQSTRDLAQKLKDDPKLFDKFVKKCALEGYNILPEQKGKINPQLPRS